MRLLSVLALTGLLVACDTVGPEPVGPPGNVVVDLGYEDGPFLRVRTVDLYGCLGYRIEADADRGDGELEIALGDVLPPAGDVCATAEGPAEVAIDLPRDIGGAAYRVFLSQGQQTDEYEIRLGFAGLGIREVRTSFSSLAE
ncbi:hypothetical protein [Rubrivirga marina]|uniref:Lipoprotein n=1 Tax=Rubrivirga marina TaxID=1196024 RepID=A0A271J4I1_9BACT|nr:hypothetical protein [Rubrivirga marina]PAP77865.1 hypothetical protein BSZ37_16170 [Rubrivirga marina]